ncbi:uncharacterized protein LOC108903284 [Anoplophora glabripennis]|uniref:uncharacterized protein LOC108903284 n=1 Tax=Anoplophora glabripennis TaxID=217634 RepID=UPI000873DB7E|nr:uncharacterized protein LOC108903284 [Anoplophora glabripennis]
MPKVMKEKCFILFFAVFIVIAKAEFDFYDCGSSMDIKTVTVSDCDEIPCYFSPGDHFTVEITLSEVSSLNRTELVTKAFLWMFGQQWELDISPVNPCTQWHCPLFAVNDLKYVADVLISDRLAKRPAHVEVVITYDGDDEQIQVLCIEFSVSLQ